LRPQLTHALASASYFSPAPHVATKSGSTGALMGTQYAYSGEKVVPAAKSASQSVEQYASV